MKKLKMLVLVVAITFSSAMSASTNPIEKAKPETVTETISELLKDPGIQFDTELSAMVEFTINKDNEIVVLSVSTQSKALESFIKHRLNYKKVAQEAVGTQKNFILPVKIKK
ncbi:MAG: hypothetical protein ACJARX_001836 [Psychroserpens sp.]|jgi:hypothetical protein|uniref:hypothetical protein n=1 Tax=Psychroserpens sp. TaxID=2020870 RepID=UPI0039E2237D